MASLYPPYPPKLEQSQVDLILDSIKSWTIAHGLAVRPSSSMLAEGQDPQGVLAIPAPVTLFPSYFPRSCFDEAAELQTVYNELYARISANERWLGQVIQE